jgi:opacity protein-like surface antigen
MKRTAQMGLYCAVLSGLLLLVGIGVGLGYVLAETRPQPPCSSSR